MDTEMLTRKVSSSTWSEKLEIFYKGKKEEEIVFVCWVSTATFLPRDRRWHSVFHVIAYSLHEVNITLSYEVCQADMGCYCEEFINRMLLTYRWQQCADRQSLATNFKADLPWFDKVFLWASFREESRQHKRGKQCGGNLQREHQKKNPKSK